MTATTTVLYTQIRSLILHRTRKRPRLASFIVRMRWRNKLLFTSAGILAVIICSVCYVIIVNPMRIFRPSMQLHIDTKSPSGTSSGSETKTILAWTTFWSDPITQSWMDSCPDYRCRIVSDRNLLKSADAVVFHIRKLAWYDLPAERYSWQRYVFMLHEPPPITWTDLTLYAGFFNWTMTYRRDSSVFWPYGLILPLANASQNELQVPTMESIANKTKIAAWFASRCKHYPGTAGREELVEALQKYVNVDVYGRCGTFSCFDEEGGNCLKMVEENYYFYLSFENSICKDYITEKFFTRVRYNVVPVVLRRHIYEGIVPSDSFIAADDFRSVEELAMYLNFLTVNKAEYLRYFQWKKRHEIVDHEVFDKASPQTGFCALCLALWNNSMPQGTIANIDQWWKEQAKCEAKSFVRNFTGRTH